ncbi:MAG: hypothetical protein WCC50_13625 [Pseudolabrys sp.]
MRRTFIAVSAVLAAWPIVALAQQVTPPGPRLASPGEIAVWSTVLTQKQDYCRRQARARKLTYLKRRRYVRASVKHDTGERN